MTSTAQAACSTGGSVAPPHVPGYLSKAGDALARHLDQRSHPIRPESLCRKELASKARPRGAIDVEDAREHYAAACPGVLRDVAYAADIQAFLGQVPAAKADVGATQFRGR
ncbi:MAG TPA: hypothetical protein VFP43_06135 [Mesorhizobium sp.]|nr:hypothetical protein [Mesorhizobium sp.]